MSQSNNSVNNRLKLIKSILKDNPRGQTIGEVAKAIQANRNSVAKYLDVLLVSGQVDLKTVGRAKVYYISQRIPLSAVLDISSNYIIVFNSKLQLVQVNDPFRWFLQKAQRTALIEPNYHSAGNFFLNELAIKNNIVGALNGQESSDEMTFQFIDGQEIFHVKYFPTIFEDGEKGATICMENITQHRQAEEQLQQSEHRYRSLFELSPIGIGLATLEGKILASNKAVHKITGFTKDELQSYNLIDMYVDKNDRQYLLDQLTHGKSISDHFIKLKRKDGTIYTACVNVTQIKLDGQLCYKPQFKT